MATCEGKRDEEKRGHTHARLGRRATARRFGLSSLCRARVKANAKRRKVDYNSLRPEETSDGTAARFFVKRSGGRALERKEWGEAGAQMAPDEARRRVYIRESETI